MILNRLLTPCVVSLCLYAGFASAQAPVLSAHETAAREVLRTMGVARTTEAGAEAMMGIIRTNPETAPFEDVFRAWYKQVFASGDLEGDMAKVYMRHFTEDELRGLTVFYKSPLGQKVLETMPAITKEGAEVGMKRAQDHLPELQEMMAKAKEERAAKKTK